jgi:hypothetical protein
VWRSNQRGSDLLGKIVNSREILVEELTGRRKLWRIISGNSGVRMGAEYKVEADYLHFLEEWLHKWKIVANETKSCHVTFTLRKGKCPAVKINQIYIPQKTTARYLGLHLDNKLTWRNHIRKNR